MTLSNSTTSRNAGCGVLVFGIVWTAFSFIFLCFGLYFVWQAMDRSTWEEVPCEIESFEIKHNKRSDEAFTPEVRFRYQWNGESRTGTSVYAASVSKAACVPTS